MYAPEAVLKRLPAGEAVSTIGVILRGQFYIYDVCRKRVKKMNKNLKEGSKPINVRAPMECMLNVLVLQYDLSHVDPLHRPRWMLTEVSP